MTDNMYQLTALLGIVCVVAVGLGRFCTSVSGIVRDAGSFTVPLRMGEGLSALGRLRQSNADLPLPRVPGSDPMPAEGASLSRQPLIKLDPPRTGKYNFSSWPESMSFSQCRQDIILAPLFKDIRNGFFVESGARDGQEHSNTIYYEWRGWQGLLIEPSREYFHIADKCRKAYVFHGALSPIPQSTKLGFWDSADGLSHVDAELPSEVQAEPLELLLHAVDPDRKTVDFWSLDIEGSEGPVLESTNFSNIEFGVLMIEYTLDNIRNQERITAAMSKNGFKDIGRTDCSGRYLDHVFLNEAYFRKRGLAVPGRITGLY